jgi:flagellar hook-basal body complex protein FliE
MNVGLDEPMNAILLGSVTEQSGNKGGKSRPIRPLALVGACYCAIVAGSLYGRISMSPVPGCEQGPRCAALAAKPNQESIMDPISAISRPGGLSSLGGIGGIGSIGGNSALSATQGAGGASFGKALEDALGNVSKLQDQSTQMAKDFQAENPNVSLEETMIAMQQSQLSFQAVVQVRNKLVTAYNEVMNMQM